MWYCVILLRILIQNFVPIKIGRIFKDPTPQIVQVYLRFHIYFILNLRCEFSKVPCQNLVHLRMSVDFN